MEKKESFINEPSKRFYNLLTELIGAKKLTSKEVVTKFGKYENNPRNYFNALSTGKISVTVDQILKAQEHFEIDPCKLFTETNSYSLEEHDKQFLVREEQMQYSSQKYLDIIKSQQATIASQQKSIEEMSLKKKNRA